jgi:hypothetical protein
MKEKESGSFLKKRTKKLFLTFGTWAVSVSRAPRSKSFFASFFSKKEVLP